jgi:hypothetical protein
VPGHEWPTPAKAEKVVAQDTNQMRAIISGLVLVVISIATAAAQSYPNAAPTQTAPEPAAATSPAPAPAAVPTAAAPPAAPLYPSGSADFHVNGADVIRAAPPLTPEQQKAEEASQAAWQARCRPTAVEDREGIRRTRYAAPDCDLSTFNTVGAK